MRNAPRALPYPASVGGYARRLLACSAIAIAAWSGLGCDDPAPMKPAKLEVKPNSSAPEPETTKPAPSSLPRLRIDEISAQVGPTRAFLTNSQGHDNALELEQLRTDLARARSFIEGQSVTVEVNRKAKTEWVNLFLNELFALAPSSVKVQTETRTEFPKAIEFIAENKLKELAPCTLVGFISKDRSTSVWKVSGGAARRRARGLSGPDFSRTADTIANSHKGCKSDAFVVHAITEIEWGMVYDLAGAGMTAPKAELKRALLPKAHPTPGQALSFN
jgi:hypothetical protein